MPSRLISPLALTVTAAAGRSYVPFVRRHLRAARALLDPPPPLRELSLAFVGDRRMSELHVQFMNIPGPTDVLTFTLDVDRRGRPTAGEVVVCVPEARRQASRARNAADGLPPRRDAENAVRRELLLYALHGLLHLCGFDDRTDAAYRKMHRTEDDILRRLGVGAVFAPETAPHTLPRTGRPPANFPRPGTPHPPGEAPPRLPTRAAAKTHATDKPRAAAQPPAASDPRPATRPRAATAKARTRRSPAAKAPAPKDAR